MKKAKDKQEKVETKPKENLQEKEQVATPEPEEILTVNENVEKGEALVSSPESLFRNEVTDIMNKYIHKGTDPKCLYYELAMLQKSISDALELQ